MFITAQVLGEGVRYLDVNKIKLTQWLLMWKITLNSAENLQVQSFSPSSFLNFYIFVPTVFCG